jgi:hypothetical protein
MAARQLHTARAMQHHHTIVWLDQQEARIFHLGGEGGGDIQSEKLHAPHHHVHRHPNQTAERSQSADTQRFHATVTEAIATGAPVLIVGPSKAKLELIRYLHRHAPLVEAKVVGVETVDHPSDGQLIAYARKYFLESDGMK